MHNDIYAFSMKWIEKFRSPDTNYIELTEHYMADDCTALGFVMDCGNSFCKKYDAAFSDCAELRRIIDSIDDIPLLGSAVFSKWRYFNHWSYSGAEILEPKNREWFIIILQRLAQISSQP